MEWVLVAEPGGNLLHAQSRAAEQLARTMNAKQVQVFPGRATSLLLEQHREMRRREIGQAARALTRIG